MTSKDIQSFADSYLNVFDDERLGVDRTCAVLCIHSHSLRAIEITQLINLQPTSIVEASLAREFKDTRRPHGWFLSSEKQVSSKELKTHLDWLIAEITPNKKSLFKLQRRRGIKVMVRCPWWTNGDDGPVLWPAQMMGLGQLNLECAFDFKDYRDVPEIALSQGD